MKNWKKIAGMILVGSSLSLAMPIEQMKQILTMTESSWVSFRDYNGKQLIYFTHLESYKCGINEVKYSINSDKLDKVWTLEPCDEKNPMVVTKAMPYLSLALGSAKFIDLQVVFKDGNMSKVIHKEP